MIERRFTSNVPVVRVPSRASQGSDSLTIAGLAAVFNSETQIGGGGGFFREKIAPGAFKDALKRDDVLALFNHDDDVLLGRASAGTLRLTETREGLAYEVSINERDPIALAVLARVQRRDVTGSSFSFTVHPDDERWVYDNKRADPLRIIYRVSSLIDVSPVTRPAYVETTATARQHDDRGQLRLLEAQLALAKARRA